MPTSLTAQSEQTNGCAGDLARGRSGRAGMWRAGQLLSAQLARSCQHVAA